MNFTIFGHHNFMETLRKFTITKLWIHNLGTSSLLIGSLCSMQTRGYGLKALR